MSINMRFDPSTSSIVLDLDDVDKDSGAVRLCIILEFCGMLVVRSVKFLLGGTNSGVKFDCRVRWSDIVC